MKGDREQRRVVLRRLIVIKQDLGHVPNEAVDAAAHMLGLSRRQVRRLVANGGDGDPREPFCLTNRMIDYLFAARGNAWKAHSRLIAAGVAVRVGPRQFQRAVDQRVDQALVAGAKRGLDGVIAATVYLGRPVAHRNDIWAIDHTPIPVAVRPRRRGLPPYVPWVTTVMDEATGMWIAATVKDSAPNGADTAAVIAKGINGFHLSDGTFVGGLPDVLLSDRGGDLMTDPVTGPRQGPRQPAVHRTRIALAERSGRADAGTHQSGVGHRAPRLPVRRPLLLPAQAQPVAVAPRGPAVRGPARGAARAGDRALERAAPPQGQDTRAAVAGGPRRDPRRGPRGTAPGDAPSDETRVVNKGTVEFQLFFYTDPKLKGLHQQRVDVRYLPGVNDFIEIYLNGKHVCRAARRETLTLEQRDRVIAARKEQKETFLAHLAQGDSINAEAVRNRLRALGYADQDLPGAAEGEHEDEAERVEVGGQQDLLAGTGPDNATDGSQVAAPGVPYDDLDELASTIGAPMPGPRGDQPLTGTGG